MKDLTPDMQLQHNEGLRPRIVCDLVDCGCKSSTMIWISHSLKAIWFETPKAASASIKRALNIIPAPPVDVRSPLTRLLRRPKRIADSFTLQFEMWKGDEYQVLKQYPDYFKFAIVRNPWDRMVSNWSMFCRAGLPDRERKIEILFGKKPHEIGFDEFIRRSVSIHNHHWQQFVDFLPWDADTLLIDYLGRVESLADDWDEISQKLGINVKLLINNQTGHRHYRNYYEEELRDIVASSFKDDIRAFDYEF